MQVFHLNFTVLGLLVLALLPCSHQPRGNSKRESPQRQGKRTLPTEDKLGELWKVYYPLQVNELWKVYCPLKGRSALEGLPCPAPRNLLEY